MEEKLDEMRRGYHPYTAGVALIESLYRESRVSLPGQPYHNAHINYYINPRYCPGPRDTSPIYTPSKQYVFSQMKEVVTFNTEHKGGEGDQEETLGCAICIVSPDPSVTKSLLTACRTISQHQPITDLCIEELLCDDITEIDVFTMGRNAVSLRLESCSLPLDMLNHLLHQMSDCNTLRTIHLWDTSLEEGTSLNLSNKGVSLTRLVLWNTWMSPELCESVCKQLRHLIHLEHINLSGNPLGIHGHHITKSIRSWGPDPPLQVLWLRDCMMRIEVWGPLLAALSTCKHLTVLGLSGNSLTGCLSSFLPDPHPGLHSLGWLHVDSAALNREDVLHITHLIQTNKLQRLGHLDLHRNNLCVMEDVWGGLIEACVNHHQRELSLLLWLGGNNLSEECVRRCRSRCEGTNIRLSI